MELLLESVPAPFSSAEMVCGLEIESAEMEIPASVCAADTGDVIPVKASPAAKHNAASCCFFMNVTLLCV